MKKALLIGLVAAFFSAESFAAQYKYHIMKTINGTSTVYEGPAYKGNGGRYSVYCSSGKRFTTDYRYGRADSTYHRILVKTNSGWRKLCTITTR